MYMRDTSIIIFYSDALHSVLLHIYCICAYKVNLFYSKTCLINKCVAFWLLLFVYFFKQIFNEKKNKYE